MKAETKRVLLEGLRGAAEYGTASALKTAGVSALAKTGTVTTASGASLGLVVALAPADRPTRGIVVAAPGGAGVDAASIAAEILSAHGIRPSRGNSGTFGATARGSLRPQSAPLAPVRFGAFAPQRANASRSPAVDDYIAQVLAGEGQPRGRGCGAAGAGDHRAHVRDRQSQPASPRRLRLVRHHALPGAACRDGRDHGAPPRPRRVACSCTRGSRRLSFIPRGAAVIPSWRRRSGPARSTTPTSRRSKTMRARASRGGRARSRPSDLERALRAAGLRGSTLRDLRILSRNQSDRVARIRVEGFTPPEINGHEFRMAVGRIVGWQALKSTAFDLERTSSGYRFRGRGFGHGVGLCVIGAGHRASRGATADQILRFYFPGLSVGGAARESDDGGDPLHPPAAPPAVPRPTDIALALPGIGRRRACRAALADSAQPRRGHEGDRRDRAGATSRDRASQRREFRARHGTAVVGGGRDRRAGDRSAADHDAQAAGPARARGAARGDARRARRRTGRPPDVGPRRRGGVLCEPVEKSRRAARARARARAMPNCCARCPPARSAKPTRAPKPVSRARSPTASAGIK